MSSETQSGPSLLTRLLAVIVLVVAAFILFKLVKGILLAILFPVLVIGAIIAVVWAVRVLR